MANRAPDPGADWRVGRTVVLVVAILPIDPTMAAVAGIASWVTPIVRVRRLTQNREETVRREMPDVIDLFRLAIGAGLTVPLALEAVTRRGDGLVIERLAAAHRSTGLGERLGDALDAVHRDLGDAARPLTRALAASERYGIALGDALERVAHDARIDRRRRAETVARRIPVRLLFPLVLCILPAFALLTVVPALAGSLGSLQL